ncbi:MAG: hypothetical protein SGI89_05130 [bacterium]|nr:hypothetical protein [bacterium]
MKKTIFSIIILFTICLININAQASDFTKAMMKAKKNLKPAMDKADEKALIKSRGEFERILQLKEDPWLVNYYIALADHSLSLTASKDEKMDKVKTYTESGIEAITKSLDLNPEFADSYVLLEALHFNRWSYEQDKMQEIIAATTSADESAKKLEPTNPRLLLITGISQFYTPEAFGGGYKVSIPTLEKSVASYKTRKEKSELYPDWGYEMAMGYMALNLLKRNDDGDKVKAKEYIDEAVKYNPDAGFITEYVMKEYKDASK